MHLALIEALHSFIAH